MTNDVLIMRGVTREYAVGGPFAKKKTLKALRGIDLTVSRGQTLGLVGESGCGKSTLAKILLGVEEPTAGIVLVDGRPLNSYDRLERAKLIQPVFQDPYSSLNPRMTVEASFRRRWRFGEWGRVFHAANGSRSSLQRLVFLVISSMPIPVSFQAGSGSV